MLTRREFVLLLAGLMVLPAGTAFAKDGDDDKGDDNSGSGGDDDGGDDHSGSGGGGDDASEDDDNDHGGDDNDDGSGGGSGKRGEARKARDAVKKGKVIPLREVLQLVRSKYPGRVIKVDVSENGNNLIYSIKLIDEKSRRMQIRVNANQRRIIGAKFI